MFRVPCWSLIVISLLGATAFTAPKVDENGFRIHVVDSDYQSGETTIRVLLPDNFVADKSYRVLYVLPVIEHDNRRHGDGLMEVRKHGFHNEHDLICVAPEFTHMPWYADHDINPHMRDESHLLKVVLPFIEKTYPAIPSRSGRLLMGFSKSGWGAFTLLLRNAEVFHKAAGWDTGIRVDTGPIEETDREERIQLNFGTAANFERYRISTLIKERGETLGSDSRIFYYNTEGRRAAGGVIIHQLMVEEGVPHRYVYEPKREHRWGSGWIPQAVAFLVE